MPKVIPFQISIGARDQSGNYSLRAQSNSVEVRAALAVPDDVLALVAATGDMSPVRAEEFGLALGRTLFVQPIRELLLHTAQTLMNQDAYIQIQLRVAVPELVTIPWEWVTLGTTRAWRPATRDDYTLVRVGRHAAPADPVAVAGPLRVLIAAARGEDQAADALAQALDSHDEREIAVEVLRHATPTTLDQALRRQKVHILHCVAPIELSQNGTPRVLLGKGIEGFDLVRLLADAPRLHLATFTGAHSDNSGVTVGAAALASLAVDEHLPAAIAFAGNVPATLATRFAATCYVQLAEGAMIDQAVTTGRQALEETGRNWGYAAAVAGAGQRAVVQYRRCAIARDYRTQRYGKRCRASSQHRTAPTFAGRAHAAPSIARRCTAQHPPYAAGVAECASRRTAPQCARVVCASRCLQRAHAVRAVLSAGQPAWRWLQRCCV